ncbi:1-(5-phosphoribosyl)-5-[(5-phosphoribosylamino)methylideneamino]imidazole-4-carboxamide isomerase [Helicobacter muridarum]|uniref:1-(5-phosphoribosyl)-5-[(5-phosphoribosylamino)methylideneamino] imidazole-4-carboxamide isomerase n=1 Tax=Helicobacter muridarum TaxID=216 RepID=A0A099TZI0_9HELI|nr:1-(5-phosphoribosyl)-5-[(5-phosphoribosylamino)methylideneamino]imidazole-4-carboxamide isomerase [Helicobacter muridarum]TLD99850.1 1-(5-phosphoribosyl)-5-[(5-phosphoribosylamino)methylideneamino]imidazole-4-carboxamide isomerase [Helicobacter muridarum]STQ86941.1 1-(5-phosphoribosyl)-5-[(5-phosphoribosylamino)methylideneamino] imidazole-4-carboxamide isomerase [Helicobacter muridarum]
MKIFPAIDLLDSKAVRLVKGDIKSAKIYGNALDFAKYFEDCGAEWIHIVDLNGAFEGSPKNLSTIENIISDTSLKIQVGGGIRSEEYIIRYRNSGATRVILGSAALNNPNWAKDMANLYSIAISIDSRESKVATDGWVEDNDVSALDFAEKFRASCVEAIICTDISRDGLLSGINIELTCDIARRSGIFTIASGGFSGYHELEALCNCDEISAVIVGKAFYEKKLDFKNIRFTF